MIGLCNMRGFLILYIRRGASLEVYGLTGLSFSGVVQRQYKAVGGPWGPRIVPGLSVVAAGGAEAAMAGTTRRPCPVWALQPELCVCVIWVAWNWHTSLQPAFPALPLSVITGNRFTAFHTSRDTIAITFWMHLNCLCFS